MVVLFKYLLLVVLLVVISGDLVQSRLNGEGYICGRPMGTSATKIETSESRIVGGYDVGYYRYSWFAALLANGSVACGGALIGSNLVLSAAHCYKEYVIPEKNQSTVPSSIKLEDVYSIGLGIYNKCEPHEKTQKNYSVEKVILHEKYKDNLPYYDIAIIKLKESAHDFQPICLPKNEKPLTKAVKTRPKEGTTPGLGTLKYKGPTPCTLHEARLLIYPDDVCKKMINDTGNDPSKVIKAFCAGYMQGGIDTCQGDSGGPFQIIDEFGNQIILGLVSFGFHCANPGLLGMYTDVSEYVDWISEKTGFKSTIQAADNFTTTVSDDNETIISPLPTTNIISPTTKKPPPHRPQKYYHPFFRPIIIILDKNLSKNQKVKSANLTDHAKNQSKIKHQRAQHNIKDKTSKV